MPGPAKNRVDLVFRSGDGAESAAADVPSQSVDSGACIHCNAICGGAAATMLFRWLVPALPDAADQVVVPHPRKRGSWSA
jgi:hypothetical protein